MRRILKMDTQALKQYERQHVREIILQSRVKAWCQQLLYRTIVCFLMKSFKSQSSKIITTQAIIVPM